jgi:hypothetical protein
MINRKSKNQKLLKFRKDIVARMGEKCQVMSYADYVNSDTPPLEETDKSKNKLVVLGPPINNESYYTPCILSFALINNKTNVMIQKELQKLNIMIGVPDANSINIYNEIKIPKLLHQYIIRISLSDDISHHDINKFINNLQKLL